MHADRGSDRLLQAVLQVSVFICCVATTKASPRSRGQFVTCLPVNKRGPEAPTRAKNGVISAERSALLKRNKKKIIKKDRFAGSDVP